MPFFVRGADEAVSQSRAKLLTCNNAAFRKLNVPSSSPKHAMLEQEEEEDEHEHAWGMGSSPASVEVTESADGYLVVAVVGARLIPSMFHTLPLAFLHHEY